MDEISKKNDQIREKNAELELKTALLMKEVDNVMKLHESGVIEEENEEADDGVLTAAAGSSRLYNTSRQNKTVQLRPTNPASSEPELRFLRAKVKILTNEITRLQNEYRNKTSEWRSRENELRVSQQEQEKASHQVKSLEQQLTKLAARLAEHQDKTQKCEADTSKFANELQCAKRDTKKAQQHASNLEVRFNRLIEEAETLKAALRNAHLQNKDEREEQRQTLAKQTAILQRADRQRAELALAFRRQMLLCHNLLCQKDLLVAGAAVQAAEMEFEEFICPGSKRKNRTVQRNK